MEEAGILGNPVSITRLLPGFEPGRILRVRNPKVNRAKASKIGDAFVIIEEVARTAKSGYA
jgi:hypothetical protein